MNSVLFALVVLGGLALTRSEGTAVPFQSLCCFSDCTQRCLDQGGETNSCIENCNSCESIGCQVYHFEPQDS